jgi:hypothetical protein
MIEEASDPRKFLVLVAGGDMGLNRVIGNFLTSKTGRELPPLRLLSLEMTLERKIREIVGGIRLDLCTLVLNNIIFDDSVYKSPNPREARLRATVDLVWDLVHCYSLPVVGFYGWPDDPDYPERVTAAGASAVIRLPFDGEALREVAADILTRRVQAEAVQNTIPNEWASRQERQPAEPGDPPTSD